MTPTITDDPAANETAVAADLAAPPAPLAAPEPPMSPAPAAVNRPARWHLLALLAICALAGLLRFSFMDRPLLWGDDAYTIYRTHADYQSMLDILQYDGFTPLHYELYWLLGRASGTQNSVISADGVPTVHATGLTPRVVRLLPAFWGTMMVPGVYFLAVQILRRRTALVAALFAATSAYLLGYSRDGKMYMMQWCFSAWSAATLLWWLRTNRPVAFLAWVATSLGMSSSHMTGMALLPLEALFFLTRAKVDWRQSILFVIGLAIAAIPPAAYITQFNRWAQEQVEDFGFEVEGLSWVVPYNAGRSGPDLVRYATSAYLLSWEWPKTTTEDKTQPWIVSSLKFATVLFLVLATVGMMPWSRRLRGIHEGDLPPPEPWWRAMLWLGAWLIVPVYFLYCRSVVDFASPKDWWRELSAALAGAAWQAKDGTVGGTFWLFLIVAMAIVAGLAFFVRRFRQSLVWLFPILGVALFWVALLRNGLPSGPMTKDKQWVLAAVAPFETWWDWMVQPAVFVALAILLPGLILYYCGRGWGERAKRIAQFALVATALVGSCWLVYTVVQNKFDKEVAEVLEPKALSGTGGVSSSQVLARHSAAELAMARSHVETRVWQSIFMPRYMGFVWIAFGIALCALLMRLPTRPLRIAAVALLVAVNLAQFSGRLFAGTEPPLDRVANEIWAHDTTHNPHGDGTARVYVNDAAVAGPGHPGYGTLSGQQGKYYLGLARGYWIHPSEWKRVNSEEYFDIHGSGGRIRGGGPRGRQPQGLLSYPSIAADIRRSPQLKRVIVWEKYFDEDPPKSDPLLPLLGPEWARASEPEDYSVRFHWTWADLYIYRRTEYVKR